MSSGQKSAKVLLTEGSIAGHYPSERAGSFISPGSSILISSTMAQLIICFPAWAKFTVTFKPTIDCTWPAPQSGREGCRTKSPRAKYSMGPFQSVSGASVLAPVGFWSKVTKKRGTYAPRFGFYNFVRSAGSACAKRLHPWRLTTDQGSVDIVDSVDRCRQCARSLAYSLGFPKNIALAPHCIDAQTARTG